MKREPLHRVVWIPKGATPWPGSSGGTSMSIAESGARRLFRSLERRRSSSRAFLRSRRALAPAWMRSIRSFSLRYPEDLCFLRRSRRARRTLLRPADLPVSPPPLFLRWPTLTGSRTAVLPTAPPRAPAPSRRPPVSRPLLQGRDPDRVSPPGGIPTATGEESSSTTVSIAAEDTRRSVRAMASPPIGIGRPSLTPFCRVRTIAMAADRLRRPARRERPRPVPQPARLQTARGRTGPRPDHLLPPHAHLRPVDQPGADPLDQRLGADRGAGGGRARTSRRIPVARVRPAVNSIPTSLGFTDVAMARGLDGRLDVLAGAGQRALPPTSDLGRVRPRRQDPRGSIPQPTPHTLTVVVPARSIPRRRARGGDRLPLPGVARPSRVPHRSLRGRARRTRSGSVADAAARVSRPRSLAAMAAGSTGRRPILCTGAARHVRMRTLDPIRGAAPRVCRRPATPGTHRTIRRARAHPRDPRISAAARSPSAPEARPVARPSISLPTTVRSLGTRSPDPIRWIDRLTHRPATPSIDNRVTRTRAVDGGDLPHPLISESPVLVRDPRPHSRPRGPGGPVGRRPGANGRIELQAAPRRERLAVRWTPPTRAHGGRGQERFDRLRGRPLPENPVSSPLGSRASALPRTLALPALPSFALSAPDLPPPLPPIGGEEATASVRARTPRARHRAETPSLLHARPLTDDFSPANGLVPGRPGGMKRSVREIAESVAEEILVCIRREGEITAERTGLR